ncbi:hypothetical protein D3C71_1313390 [compost metagenome]
MEYAQYSALTARQFNQLIRLLRCGRERLLYYNMLAGQQRLLRNLIVIGARRCNDDQVNLFIRVEMGDVLDHLDRGIVLFTGGTAALNNLRKHKTRNRADDRCMKCTGRKAISYNAHTYFFRHNSPSSSHDLTYILLHPHIEQNTVNRI